MITLATGNTVAAVASSASAVTCTLFGDELSNSGVDAFKVLAQIQIAASAFTIYTVPVSTTTLLKTVMLANTTGASVTVTVYINGTSAVNQVASLPIPANGEATWSASGWKVLDAGGQVLQSIAPGPHSVANSMLTQIAAHTYKGNNTGSTADVLDVTAAQLTADLAAATQAAQGALSAADKLKLDNAWYDANAVGILTSNTGAQNVTAFNAWYATAPLFATLYVPPGFYDFASELTLGRDIRLRVLGAGKGRSILRNTSASAHLFRQTIAGYYISFEELGFGATVTKTAGSAIRSEADNAYLDVRRCEFTGQFQGVDWAAATSGNVGTINECLFTLPSSTASTDTTGGQIIINGSNINMMIENCTINVGGQQANGLVVRQSGAVQVNCCDFIGGRNTLLVNATGVVSALYFSNCFFDQATFGSTVKFMGTFAASRIKFVQCGITNGGGSGLVACEIAGTGTGTAIPEAIDFLLCDFYNNGFAGTTTGILVTGCRGFDIRLCRIAGFTVGIDITPYNANGITNFNIQGNTIGPTENFAANGTGIRINAGSFQFGTSLIVGNDLTGNTTAALVNNGTYAANAPLKLSDNLGLSVAPVPMVATPATFGAVETILHQISLPANSLLAGTTLRFKAHGTVSATAAGTFLPRLRIGTLGTTGDTQVCATVATGAVTAAVGWAVEGYITIRTIGAGGTALGNVSAVVAATSVLSLQTATVAVNTTVANFIELTAIGGGTTPVVTVVQAFCEVVKQ